MKLYASRQCVNYGESKLFFSPNVLADVATTTSSTLGMPTTIDLGKYLGYSHVHEGKNTKSSSELLQMATR